MESERLEEIIRKLGKLDDLGKEIDSVTEAVAGFNKRVDEIERRLEHHQDQVTKIKDVVQLAQTDLKQFEVHTRKNNIEINGVPEVPKEDLLLLCIKLADALNVDLAKEHIDIVHRITSKNTQKPKPIILKLANRWKKELMIAANKWRKNADLKQSYPRLLHLWDSTIYQRVTFISMIIWLLTREDFIQEQECCVRSLADTVWELQCGSKRKIFT